MDEVRAVRRNQLILTATSSNRLLNVADIVTLAGALKSVRAKKSVARNSLAKSGAAAVVKQGLRLNLLNRLWCSLGQSGRSTPKRPIIPW